MFTPCGTVIISERLTVEYSFEEKLYLIFGCWWWGKKSCSKWCGDAKWEGCVTHVVGAWIFWFPFILWGRDFFFKDIACILEGTLQVLCISDAKWGEDVQLILDSCGWRELKGNIEVWGQMWWWRPAFICPWYKYRLKSIKLHLIVVRLWSHCFPPF